MNVAQRLETDNVGTSFVPDFCARESIAALLLMAALFSMVLALTAPPGYAWTRLVLISLFVLWVALGNALVLCVARRGLKGLTPIRAGLVSYLLSLAVTLAISMLALLIQALFLDQTPSWPTSAEFLLRNTAISAIVSAVALRYFYVIHQWRSHVELGAQARFDALQARIRPHFLFNSMNTIAALTRSDPAIAERTVEDLAELFRVSLGKARDQTLGEEIDLTERYLAIESLRLGERLKVEWSLSENLPRRARIPALILQPLVENAIYHGIEPSTEGGLIRIALSYLNNTLIIEMSNPAPPVAYQRRSGNRMAQENVRQRLKLAFGDRVEMLIDEGETEYRLKLEIPLNIEE